MKRLGTILRTVLPLALIVILLAGCGLFNGVARERERENAQVTKGAQLGRVVTAEGIGAQNAPVKETDTFSDSQDYIYVVAEADHIDQGTTMFARWFRAGQPIEDSSELTADR